MIGGITSAAALVGVVTGDGRPVLSPKTPLESARQFVRAHYTCQDRRTIHHQAGVFYVWTGTHYVEAKEEELVANLTRFLDGALRIEGDSTEPFNPTNRRISDIIGMLRAEVQLPQGIAAPAWLGPEPHAPAQEFFACGNGLLHLATKTLYPHTPDFFGLNAVVYNYDATAEPPWRWLRFLKSLWPENDEGDNIDTLQEWFGYVLSGGTSYQKGLMLIGAPRSGKGTVCRTLTALIGGDNVAAPTLETLSSNFGRANLIGRPLAIVADARLSARTNQAPVVECILSIIGEDTMTVDRKFKDSWGGKLPTRIMLCANEVPKLADTSGAFASRWIVLNMPRSFLGNEDHELGDDLKRELPGILAWACEGWLRLASRKRFLQPASSHEDVQMLADLSSPVKEFLRERTINEGRVLCDAMYQAWCNWCGQHGQKYPGTSALFGRDIRAAVPRLQTKQAWYEGVKRRFYVGITLTDSGQQSASPSGRADFIKLVVPEPGE